MERPSVFRLLVAILLATTIIPACDRPVPIERLPLTSETLTAIGKRLSQKQSAAELSKLAPRGDLLLASLTSKERDALGRGYLRFQVDRPAIVEVAASPSSIPFWLSDQKFLRTAETVRIHGADWPVFRQRFQPGWIGLGVNGLDRSAPTHYVAFVRPATGRSLAVSKLVPDDWRVVAAHEGVSTTFDSETPIERLPAILKEASLLQSARGRRNSTLLARGRVWKTHVVSGTSPDQVTIAFGSDPASSLAWTWRTSAEVRSTSLRIAPASESGTEPADPRTIRLVRGESTRVEIRELLNDPVIRRHRVVVDGLEPDTKYLYSLGDGSAAGWTRWQSVKTAPARLRNYRFLYLGDAQCGLEGWGKLLHKAFDRNTGAGFVLLAGDLVDRGNERTNWDHFFLRAEGVFDKIPLMPCAGNHEYLDRGPWLYSSFFELPRNGPIGIDPKLVYSFEYGDSFVAVLDSTLAVFSQKAAQLQAEWLDAALARTRATWKFVMFHHPVYASHPTRLYPSLLEVWGPVFDKHHVDMVLQGHDHAYLRTYPMYADQPVESNAQGTTYVVSVSGEKYCDVDPRNYTAASLSHVSTYQTIDIDVARSRLTYRAWDLQGREVDQLLIEKPPQVIAHRRFDE